MWGVHTEDGEPPRNPGFHWSVPEGGELIHATAYLDRAIVLTHDCEIENEPRHRTIAMVRPIEVFSRDLRPKIDNLENHAAFALPADRDFGIPHSWVDLRRVTVVRPQVLEASGKIGRLNEEGRKALAEHFWDYLFRPIKDADAGIGAST